ncbi:carboxypeptidase-like regulatory domain-containing protein [Zhouia sp. PK063]|uniref:TonB-dependent receptor n=1 Tax=Zhouia sp. PK063 TaxID=3373602 RepID=UPI0037B8EE9C
MKKYITLFLIIIQSVAFAQTTVSGIVTDQKGMPIEGANVYLENTYDGGSTNAKGVFNFTTEESGTQTLVVSFITFQTYKKTAEVTTFSKIKIALKEEINTLTGVTLTAGNFEAGDNSKASVLKPLDIVTTASAVGDVFGALQTLPGTTTVAEDGRLFVRGGSAEETQIFIDGMRVFSPYTPTAKNLPTRGRYSPFLFKGISFSTGGYSAEYGQALSSVLLLNTIDKPTQNQTDISIMTLGGGLGHTSIWGKNSISINTSYINLKPYLEVVPDRNNWKKPYESISGEAVYRHQFENGLFKFYTAYDYTSFNVFQEDINYDDLIQFKIKNTNMYTNASYKGVLNNDWIVNGGVSFSATTNDLNIVNDAIDDKEIGIHGKLKFIKSFHQHIKLNVGGEFFTSTFKEHYMQKDASEIQNEVTNKLPALFAESDIYFTNKLAAKVGIRASYASITNEWKINPRLSLAYKTGEHDQVAVAYGIFNQLPQNSLLKYEQPLQSSQAAHYIFNYQYVNNGKTFRAETYYKKYTNLFTYEEDEMYKYSNLGNNGKGYATGLDVFWRDNKSFKNIDYWVSYSYLDTQRKFEDYPNEVTPSFAAKHNLSLVGKFWVNALKSQFGVTYNFSSGRPYNNPNRDDFMNSKTKSYNNISLSCAYLLSQQKILFISLSNPFGFKNVNGYQFTNTPNAAGFYDSRTIKPASDTFFFVGFFWTISDHKKTNQLDNL